jgi:hypothetical protein
LSSCFCNLATKKDGRGPTPLALLVRSNVRVWSFKYWLKYNLPVFSSTLLHFPLNNFLIF